MDAKACLFDGCTGDVYIRNMCSWHYRRVQAGTIRLPNAREEAVARVGSMGWQEHAACRTSGHPEDWFPVSEKPDNPIVVRARAVCGSCPVVLRCAEWALNTGMTDGIFGGLTSGERRRIRQAAKAAELESVGAQS